MIYKPTYFNDHGQEVTADSKENKLYYIAAYNDNGDYVGNRTDGRYLEKIGIVPELRTPTSGCCSIGFCASEQKWYGWSHRAIYGFGIGGAVKKGDCAYVTSDVDELYNGIVTYTKKENVEKLENGVCIKHEIVRNVDPEVMGYEVCIDYEPAEPIYQIIKCGKGEWTAQTLEDAKQMAMDFAKGVN